MKCIGRTPWDSSRSSATPSPCPRSPWPRSWWPSWGQFAVVGRFSAWSGRVGCAKQITKSWVFSAASESCGRWPIMLACRGFQGSHVWRGWSVLLFSNLSVSELTRMCKVHLLHPLPAQKEISKTSFENKLKQKRNWKLLLGLRFNLQLPRYGLCKLHTLASQRATRCTVLILAHHAHRLPLTEVGIQSSQMTLQKLQALPCRGKTVSPPLLFHVIYSK